jgi:hypothetical protein
MTISLRTYRSHDDFRANSLLASSAGKIFFLPMSQVSRPKALIATAFPGAFRGLPKNFPYFSRA